jgi:predicted SprT family Zn-dependent metalloprotease
MWTPKALYKFWNCRYFGSRLPDIPVVWSTSGRSARAKKHIMGSTWFDHETGRPKKITLNPKFKIHNSLWQSTLLHEMVHVQQWRIPAGQEHGNKFNRRMKQLAAKGAFRYLW